jgi:hypothetical protein
MMPESWNVGTEKRCVKSIARHWLSKHVLMSVNMHTTIEELLETVFSLQGAQKLYRQDQ